MLAGVSWREDGKREDLWWGRGRARTMDRGKDLSPERGREKQGNMEREKTEEGDVRRRNREGTGRERESTCFVAKGI